MPRLLLIMIFAATAIRSGLTTAQETDEQTPLEVTITAPLIETRWQDATSGVTLIDDDDIGDGRSPLQPTDALNRVSRSAVLGPVRRLASAVCACDWMAFP